MDDAEFQATTSGREQLPEQVPYPRSVVVLVSFLLVGIGLVSAWYMVSRLRLNIPTFGQGGSIEEISQSLLAQQDEQLRLQDSDADGVSDYDELRTYGTSPFIADTDSDGVSDKQELADGTDPACPKGQTCGSIASNSDTRLTGPTFESPYATQDVKGLLQDPKSLRSLLITAGADPELVAGLDDQTVQLLAQQALADISGPTPEKIDALKDLTVDQIRDILRNFGMTEEDVNALSDEEVTSIYQEALTEFEASTPQQ